MSTFGVPDWGDTSFTDGGVAGSTPGTPGGGGTGGGGTPTPTIVSFIGSTTTSTAGTPLTLSFEVTDATTISISPDIGPVLESPVTVSPATTTIYTITASGPGGSVTATFTVTVAGPSAENIRYHQIRRNDRQGDGILLQMSGPGNTAVDGYLALYDGGGNVIARQPRGNTTVAQLADLTGGYTLDHLLAFDGFGNAKDSTVLSTDVVTSPGGGHGLTVEGAGRWYEQIPVGVRNGVNLDFYTDFIPITPVSGTPPVVPFQLFKNGLALSPYVPRYSLAAGSNHIVMASGNAPKAADEFICWYFIGDPGTLPPSAVSSAQATVWTSENGGSYSPLVDIQYWHPNGTSHDPIVTFDNSSWSLRQNTATVTGITTTTDMAGGFVQFSLDGTVFGTSSPPATIKIYDCYLTLTLVGGGTTLVRPTSWSFDSGSDQPATSWKKNTVYATGVQVMDSNSNIQQAAVGGLSGASPPVWHTSGSTTDNTITWNFIGPQTSSTGQISGSPTLGYDTDSVPPTTFFSLSRTGFSGFSTPGSVRLIF